MKKLFYTFCIIYSGYLFSQTDKNKQVDLTKDSSAYKNAEAINMKKQPEKATTPNLMIQQPKEKKVNMKNTYDDNNRLIKQEVQFKVGKP